MGDAVAAATKQSKTTIFIIWNENETITKINWIELNGIENILKNECAPCKDHSQEKSFVLLYCASKFDKRLLLFIVEWTALLAGCQPEWVFISIKHLIRPIRWGEAILLKLKVKHKFPQLSVSSKWRWYCGLSNCFHTSWHGLVTEQLLFTLFNTCRGILNEFSRNQEKNRNNASTTSNATSTRNFERSRIVVAAWWHMAYT